MVAGTGRSDCPNRHTVQVLTTLLLNISHGDITAPAEPADRPGTGLPGHVPAAGGSGLPAHPGRAPVVRPRRAAAARGRSDGPRVRADLGLGSHLFLDLGRARGAARPA